MNPRRREPLGSATATFFLRVSRAIRCYEPRELWLRERAKPTP